MLVVCNKRDSQWMYVLRVCMLSVVGFNLDHQQIFLSFFFNYIFMVSIIVKEWAWGTLLMMNVISNENMHKIKILM